MFEAWASERMVSDGSVMGYHGVVDDNGRAESLYAFGGLEIVWAAKEYDDRC